MASRCLKIGYETRREANHMLKRVQKNHGRGGLRVYRCHIPGCELWHHGRKPKSRRA